MKQYFFLAFAMIIALATSSHAQQHRCNTDHFIEWKKNNDPKWEKRHQKLMEKIKNTDAIPMDRSIGCTSANTVVIPVAIHYSNDYNCTNTACLLEAAINSIAAMNADFAATNSDISVYTDLNAACPAGYPLSALSDGTCLEFCIASMNHPASSGIPDGQAAITVGEYTGGFGAGGNGAPEWPGYMNIFVVDNLGFLGVADDIPGAVNGDGVTVDGSTWGGPGVLCSSGATLNNSAAFDLGRTLTHEVGHYLGLYHVFQNGCNDEPSAFAANAPVNDTPPQQSSTSGCPNTNPCGPTSCSGEYTQFTNYMDYSNDDCLVMFSEDQAMAMNYFSVNIANWAANKCVPGATLEYIVDCSTCFDGVQNGTETSVDCGPDCPTCGPPMASFTYSPDPAELCPGNTLNLSFTDTSINGPTSWSWTFSGAGVFPTSSTSSSPMVVVSNAGTLVVNMTATNAIGNDNISENISITSISGSDPVCSPPVAAFSMSPSGNVDFCPGTTASINLTDLSGNNPTGWSWTFSGAGVNPTSSTAQNPTVTVSAAGTLNVTLNASNNNGTDSATDNLTATELPATDIVCQNCEHELVMWDKRANTWGNRNIDVTINGTTTNYTGPTNGNLSATVLLNMDSGDAVSVVANLPGGNNGDSDVSWRIFDEEGRVLIGDGGSFGFGPGTATTGDSPTLANCQEGVSINGTVNCQAKLPCEAYQLTLVTDTYGEETAWQIIGDDGVMEYQSRGYSNDNNTTIIVDFCLEEKCYDFLMYDFYGDGICCAEGNGSYELVKVSDGSIVAAGGQFLGLETTNFCVDIEDCNQFEVYNTVTQSGLYVAESGITLQNGSVITSLSTDFVAGDSIRILPNYEIPTMVDFHAYIDPNPCAIFIPINGDDTSYRLEDLIQDVDINEIQELDVIDIHGQSIDLVIRQNAIYTGHMNPFKKGISFLKIKMKDQSSVIKRLYIL